ncbi:TonB-dependent receptor [Simiduia litorea]|uniref:TonB-dependent receptor plug domain-containing protein n=1 Tax=Simiduia litorea TaxID=1435348 RepID=UPI0036F207AD
MAHRKQLSTAIKLIVLGATTTLGLAANTVSAQDNISALEEVTVTGSRISRDEFSSASAISTFDASELQKAGVTGIDEFLKDVPAFTGYQMGTSTNNGSDQGQKKIDMRGLGFNRTLVLVNGRRQIGDSSGDGAVDLNTIPSAMIKRVEVLKDGASTVYGSDALAGVVNIILHDDFEGFQVTGDWGRGVSDGQAENQSLSMLAGVAGDRGNAVFSIGWTNQDEMLQAERPWATEALYPVLQSDGTFKAVGSGSSNSRKIRVPGAGNRILDADTGIGRTFVGSDVYNYAPVNALITPNERYQFGFNGTIEITDDVKGYAEALYTKRTSQQRLAPDASFAVSPNTETPNNGVQWNDFVPANNPFNPYGVNPNNDEGLSNLDVRINRRFVESGGRLFRQSSSTYRIITGFKGDFNDKVNWDVSYTVAESETADETKNYGRFDRWAIAVDPVACAADPGCTAAGGVLNPFGDYGSISDAQMAFLTTGSLKDQYSGRMDLFAVNLSGDLFEMSGGSAGWALGFENRHEQGYYSPDEFVAGGLTTGGAGDPLSGSYGVKEVYAEAYLPVLDTLSISASTRYSDYDTSAGAKTTYKIGGDWNPTEALKVRAGYSTGFRAPNIAELNQGENTDFPIVEPICEFADRRLASGDISQVAYDNCQALGIVTDDSGELGFAWQSTYTTSAPSKPLKPEESTSINFGVSYAPEFLPGLQLSADYWDIEIENVIGSEDFNDLMQSCMNSVNLSAASCDLFLNDAGNAEPFLNSADNDGLPYPADATAEFGNLGTLSTTGWDFEALYMGEISSSVVTGYTLGWSATWQNKYERAYPLAGTRDLIGTANGFAVFPEWRYNFTAGIEGNNWSASWKMRYIGETEDALRPASITDDATAEAMLYHDLVGNYTWENISFTLGINNVTDEDAPRFHSAFNANTEPGMYDVIGRRLFTSVQLTF